MKKIFIGIVIIILLALGGWAIWQATSTETISPNGSDSDMNEENTSMQAEEEPEEEVEYSRQEVLGQSVNGQDIIAYQFGTGSTDIVLIGGIHGAYSPNTAELAQRAVEYFSDDATVPESVTVSIIPAMNPDGADMANNIEGRFNANGVDLNRNFDCNWQSEGMWQSRTVNGGDAVFSEPETRAVRDFIERVNPDAVIAYYSSADGVFASSCNAGVSAQTLALMSTYATAAEYETFESFDFYEITGDMTNWLAKRGTPAISVLLADHQGLQLQQNIAGINAVIQEYAQ